MYTGESLKPVTVTDIIASKGKRRTCRYLFLEASDQEDRGKGITLAVLQMESSCVK